MAGLYSSTTETTVATGDWAKMLNESCCDCLAKTKQKRSGGWLAQRPQMVDFFERFTCYWRQKRERYSHNLLGLSTFDHQGSFFS
jgi:hypothetical protein